MSGLKKLSTATYSTKRSPAAASGLGGASVTNLTSVASTPIMPAISGATGERKQMSINSGIYGQVNDLFEIYVEYQAHIDSTVAVTQLPDIKERDVVLVGSKVYNVWKVEEWPATSSLLAFERVLLSESV